MTIFEKNLCRLLNKMKTAQWQLNTVGCIRLRTGSTEHCPLSFCGGAPSIHDYKRGGKALGFADNQIEEIAHCSDQSGSFFFERYQRLRRLLLKAARLQEKGN
jgi:hypothetical protein